ncbi:MAG TPA: serine/threonine-protein kinase [Actinomycetota bacterium]|nr:serine/threonine-protein kinase [Actinomycetota bacterium]
MTSNTQPVTVIAGRYALEERLGRSPTGMVWRAHDTLLGRTVIVRLVHPELADDPAFEAALTEASQRIAALSIPGCARLLDSGQEGGVTFLVREYAAGTGVRERIRSGGPAPPDAARRGMRGALETLAEIHDHGIEHLALDADDVIVGDDGSVRLTDLGIGAAIAAARPADSADLLGQERLAPEQSRGERPDVRSDLFAAGAILFEWLTGEGPGGRTSPRAIRSDVPRELDRAVARALEPEPSRRYPDARAFATALGPAADDPDVVSVPETRRRAGLFGWLGIPLVIAGAVAAAIAIGVLLREFDVVGRDAPPEPTGGAETSTVPPEIVNAASVSVIDPFGDGDELSANAILASDGNPETAWRSENYFDGVLGKPGVGVVLDLGRTRNVLGLRLSTPHPGFEFHVAVGDDPDGLVDAIGPPVTASARTRVRLGATGRYVLLWITSVVPTSDGNRAEIGEAEVVVAGA